MMFTFPNGASFNCLFMLIKDHPHQEGQTLEISLFLSPGLSSLLTINDLLTKNIFSFNREFLTKSQGIDGKYRPFYKMFGYFRMEKKFLGNKKSCVRPFLSLSYSHT